MTVSPERLPLAAETTVTWLLPLSIALILGAALMWLISGAWQDGGERALGVAGGFGLAIALAIRFVNHQKRAILDAMARGDCLADWTFSAAQWAQHVADVRARRPPFLPRWIVILALSGLAGVPIGVALILIDGPVSGAALWTTVAIMAGACLAAMLVICVVVAGREALSRRRLARQPGRVLIGREALYYNGVLWRYRGPNPYLQEVRLEASPATLVFDYCGRRPYSAPHIVTLRIPAPLGCEPEAPGIVSALTHERGA
jgi:hypothetical protein